MIFSKTLVEFTILVQLWQTPQPPPIAEFAAEYLSAEKPPEKLWCAESAAEFY